jgi:hypothetical protein
VVGANLRRGGFLLAGVCSKLGKGAVAFNVVISQGRTGVILTLLTMFRLSTAIQFKSNHSLTMWDATSTNDVKIMLWPVFLFTHRAWLHHLELRQNLWPAE